MSSLTDRLQISLSEHHTDYCIHYGHYMGAVEVGEEEYAFMVPVRTRVDSSGAVREYDPGQIEWYDDLLNGLAYDKAMELLEDAMLSEGYVKVD